MGRAERRKLERKNRIEDRKSKVLLTRKDISDLKREITEYSANYSAEALMTCFALATRKLYGHGYKRIMRELQCVDDLMGAIVTGDKTIEDYKQELEDEVGIVIKC